MKTFFATSLAAIALTMNLLTAAEPDEKLKPLMRDFVGVNGHTVQFKPELYKQVCAAVRDYHPLEWDTGPDSDYPLDFPWARNRVNWQHVYGSWRQHGFFTDACIMFETLPADKWKSLADDSFHYGKRFAESFGPSSPLAVVDAVEIGNEPGKFSDAQYRTVFTAMAHGIRAGDSKLKIATCNVNVGPSGDYHKSVDCIAGLEASYDILTIHSYALLEGWPTWKRSFPEDAALPAYLQDIDRLVAWRNEHAPGKEIWLTEFGWDCSTGKPSPDGEFSKWLGNSDTEQAQWLVRSLLLFAQRDLQRAFIYFFNDDDTPQFHAASGLTRKFVPKPSFYAVGHLYRTLGDYRYERAVRQSLEAGYVLEFSHHSDPRRLIWVAWSPSGTQRTAVTEIETPGLRLVRAERMPLSLDPPTAETLTSSDDRLVIPLEESPLYIMLARD